MALISELRTDRRKLWKILGKIKSEIEAIDIVINRLERKKNWEK